MLREKHALLELIVFSISCPLSKCYITLWAGSGGTSQLLCRQLTVTGATAYLKLLN